jgi:hypothetical protein
MFTNEIEWDETVTTILDNKGNYEDVQLFIDGNEVYIRQWNEIKEEYDLIVLSHQMFTEFQIALNEGEGAFIVEE